MEATTRNLNPLKWNCKLAGEGVQEYSERFFVLLFIVNGLATFLILFNWIENVSDTFRESVGALAFAFSAVALIMFINKGVRHQLVTKKKGKN